MPEENEGSANLSVDEGAEKLLGLLSADPEEDNPEDEESRGEEPQSDEEDFEDGEELDEEDFEDDEPADEEDEEADEGDLEDRFTVKVDGEEIEVTLEEALQGFQRQEAFTRKTQRLAEERRALMERAEELTGAQQTYQQKLALVERALQQTVPQDVDWSKLKTEDPERYVELRERQDQIQAIQDEQRRAAEEQQETFRQQQERLLEIERERLEAAIPEWSVDPDKAQAEQERMVELAQEVYGYRPEELQITDHRNILVLRDAMRYRELQDKASTQTRKSTSKSKKTSKTLKPGSSKSGSRKQRSKRASKKVRQARKRLSQTGSIDDAAAVLMQAIKKK